MKIERWFDALYQCQQQGAAYVLVTLLASAGSTPRDAGTKMVITDDSCFDTIGGGHLEHQVTAQARQLLTGGKQLQHIEHYPLASKLGQCCGGTTNVLFEVMLEHTQHLAIFGAGHVAKALVPILAQLPLQIRWIDQRSELLSAVDQQIDALNNVQTIFSDDPVECIEPMPEGAWVLVMTHNHQLDFELVSAALTRPDISYVGMIGSDTKARRFQTRFQRKGFEPQQINRLISPVGLTTISGKKPIEVAVSIAGQLIKKLQPEQPNTPSRDKQAWQDSKLLSAKFSTKTV